jgi:prepilin-type N-terminal cleavage/methylation domain-containing protein
MKRAFTLMELLVVIAIVGILSAIVLTSVSSAREKAKAVKVVDEYRQIQDAFVYWHSARKFEEWPRENEWSSKDLAVIVAGDADNGQDYYGEENLRVILPDVDVLNYSWELDNDFDTYPNSSVDCSGSGSLTNGVNVLIDRHVHTDLSNGLLSEINNLIDGAIDNSTNVSSCGKVRWNNRHLIFLIAQSPNHDPVK